MTVSVGYHLYVVDDEPEFRKFIRIVAERANWRVTECSDGAALLKSLAEEDGPALILLDILMPGMDGIEAAEKLARLSRPIKIHFMTGGPQAVKLAAKYISEDHSFRMGEALSKPLTMAAILSVLDDFAV